MSTTTTLFGSAEAQAARTLVGGTTLGDTRNDLLKQILVATANRTGGSGGAAWGAITGTLSAQTDLQTALDAKLNKAGGAFTGLTGAGFRDTSAAFDVTLGFTSSVVLDAARALTIDMGNVAHTIAFGTTAGTITFPNAAALTVAGLQIANVFTAAQTISVAGAASTPALHFTGAILTGGTGTTNFPHVLIQPTGATASTTWSTSGTAYGVNLNVSGGNYFDGKIDGVTTFKIDAATGAASVYTYNAINWAVYDSVGGTLRSYELLGVWRATDGFNTIGSNGIGLQETYSGLRLKNSFYIAWSSDGNFYGTPDCGLDRLSAGIVQVTNGTTGYGTIDALGFKVSGVAGVSGTITAASTVTVVNGIVTVIA